MVGPAKNVRTKGNVKAKKPSTGNGSGPVQRLTNEWLSAKKRDVQIGDVVKLADGPSSSVWEGGRSGRATS
jgi:hypothetical protein